MFNFFLNRLDGDDFIDLATDEIYLSGQPTNQTCISFSRYRVSQRLFIIYISTIYIYVDIQLWDVVQFYSIKYNG